MNNYVVTIARGFGSGGKAIGSKLAKELGISCYENRILKMASEESGLKESLFYGVDEKLRGSYIAGHLKSMMRLTQPKAMEKKFVSDDNLFEYQSQIIKELAKTQSCVIVGKCANKVLENYENVVRVYIEAPREACLKRIMERMEVSEEKANKLITQTDKYRADYYKYYTNGDYWTNPTSYDITLNSSSLGWDNCVEIIKEVIRLKLNISV